MYNGVGFNVKRKNLTRIKPKVVFLEKNVEISILLDLYGTLLTKVQQKKP